MEAELTQEQLLEDLRRSCGVRAGDMVIVHSSAKAIGPVAGGVGAVVRAIKEAVTEEGTVLMPVFSFLPKDGVTKMKRSPSRVGLITEAFRRSEGVLRSMHPTHSVGAWGKRAGEMIAGHENTSGIGASSPFPRAAREGAYVLMIGCTLTTCSLVHASEAICRVPYLGKVFYPGYNRTLTLIDRDGHAREFPPKDVPGDGSGFKAVQAEMERRGLITRCRVGRADTLRFSAGECLDVAIRLLEADPAALLCDNPRCPVCPPSRRIIGEARG